MNNLELYKDVWVIIVEDPATKPEWGGVVAGVFQSEEAALEQCKEYMNDEEREDYVKYFVDWAPMLLDVRVREVSS